MHSTLPRTSAILTPHKAPPGPAPRILDCIIVALCLGTAFGCDRYPRDESVDGLRNVTEPLALSTAPSLLDPIDASPENNNNRIAEPGETVQLNVPLEWSGDTAQTLSFSTSQGDVASSCITWSRLTLSPTPLPAVSAAIPLNVGPIEVRLAGTPCEGGTATLNLDVTLVELNETETLTVQFPVEDRDSAISLQSVTVFDGAEGDAALSPGETAVLTVGVRNDGVSTIRGVKIGEGDASNNLCVERVKTGTNLPLIPSDSDFLAGTILALGGGSLNVTADPQCQSGDTLKLALVVQDASGERFNFSWETELQEAPLPEADAQ